MPDESNEDAFESAAQKYERVATELEVAAKHLRWTAEHFRNQEVPRACAHIVAAQGHLSKVDRQLGELAEQHAAKAQA